MTYRIKPEEFSKGHQHTREAENLATPSTSLVPHSPDLMDAKSKEVTGELLAFSPHEKTGGAEFRCHWPWWPGTITHTHLKASMGQVSLPEYKIIGRKKEHCGMIICIAN